MIGKVLRATIVSLVAATFILVLIHLVAFIEASGVLGRQLTLYYGRALDIYTVVVWLLVMDEKVMHLGNYISVLIAWIVAWYIAGEWVRSRGVIIVSSLLSAVLLILYLAAWRHAPILIYIPESLAFIYGAIISSVLLYVKEKVSRKPSFFELLEGEGFKLSQTDKNPPNIPFECRHCGATIYSSSRYCWNCGEVIL